METAVLRNLVLSESDFRTISDLVYKHCGINLHDGKKELVRARLAKRLRQGNFRTFSEYIEHLLEDKSGKEFSILIDSLSTNLTKFFREEQHFEFFRSEFLPGLLDAKASKRDQRIRGWSAGCSSGEEPYSLAITLLEAVEGRGEWDIRILATDISTRVLETARRGVYDQERLEPIPSSLKKRYFVPYRRDGRDVYQVADRLGDIVVFGYLNLVKDWPIRGPLDFIFCRNVMIYFDKPTQEHLVGRFRDLLSPGGVLLTGHSESLTGIKHGFEYIQPTIYMKK